MIEFFVEGLPLPKGSGSRARTKTGKPGRYVESADAPTQTRARGGLKRWSDAVAWRARLLRCEPIDEAVEVRLKFYLPESAKHDYPDRHGTGDVDKLARAVLDALEGHAYTNDARVCDLVVRKRYVGLEAGAPGVQVEIRRLDSEVDV